MEYLSLVESALSMKSIFKKAFFENQVLLFVLDQNARFVAVNKALRQYIGKVQERQEKILWSLVAEERSRIVLESTFTRALSGHAAGAIVLLEKIDGSVFWGDVQLSQALSDNGETVIVGSVRDVTRQELIDEKQQENERYLTDLAQRLEELNAAKSSFLGMAAHDLRTPLHKISFIADMLLNTALSDEKRRELYSIILRSSDSMRRLIDDLLNITEIESGRVELVECPVAVNEFLGELEVEYSILAEKKNSTIAVHYLSEPVELLFDAERIKQVLMNLLSNALKFSPPGSTITLRCLITDKDFTFEVHDEGPGVPEDEQALLFKPFQKLTPRPTGDEPSSGLGLAISKRLVELHDGEIGMNPAEEGGSIFWVRFRR
jgi:PAS domain S-box-containing protein